MFEDLIRELKQLEQPARIAVDMQLDDEGYFDRACPNDECGAAFKVRFDDWREKVPDDAAYCPICGVSAAPTEWNTPDQLEQIKSVAMRHVHGQLNQAMSRSARRQRPQQFGFINMSWSYKPGRQPVLVTAQASELMTQKSTCERCGCRYESVGAAFFCPACGHNSAISTFVGTVETVRATLAHLDEIRRVLSDGAGRDAAEDSARHICENALVKLVAAFQRFAEAHYDALSAPQKPAARRNVFQNLAESGLLWHDAVGWRYEDLLCDSDIAKLQTYFQQRHLLAHQDGIVDEVYLERSDDRAYEVGQRLVVRPEAVSELAGLVELLSQAMTSRLRDA